MFSPEPTKVRWFGSYLEDAEPAYKGQQALAVVDRAREACRDQDLRQDRELIAALAYLVKITGKRGPAVYFWRSLGFEDQEVRWQNATAARNAIARALPTDR